MDWSKKIGLVMLSVLILAACSSRKNYGSVYFARGDVFNDAEMDFDLSVDEYVNFADSVNNDIRSLSYYENDFIDSTDSIDSLDALYAKEKIENDTVYIESIELVKIDSLSTILNDSLGDLKVEENQIIDSLKFDVVDTAKVKIESPKDSVSPINKNKIDSTKIIYTDTIGLLREKELEESNELKSNPDSKSDSKSDTESNARSDNSSKVKNLIIVNPSLGNSNKDKPVSDSTINKNTSTEKSNVENDNQIENQIEKYQNSERAVDTKKSVAVVPLITNNNKEVKTDTVTIIKENSSYTKEMDSLKSVNDKLRSNAKSKNLNRDTLVYSVFFDSEQQKLSESNKEILNTLIQDAKEQNYMLQLSGHTDKSGSADFNKTLSENRVKSVFNYVVANGLDERKIFYQAFGANYATSENDVNRRTVSCRLILIIDN